MARHFKSRRMTPRSRFMPSTGRWAHTYGAIDLGTHNCRLLVARPSKNGFRVIDSFSRIVRLGEGIASTGRLNEAAQRRAIQALQACMEKIRFRKATRIRAITTEACRQAINADQFIARVMSETGVLLEVIGAREEAHLAIAGCVPLMEENKKYALVFDIGGGSTQVIWVRTNTGSKQGPEVIDCISIPYGVVTLGEQVGLSKLAGPDFELWVEKVSSLFQDFDQQHGISSEVVKGSVQMLGTSGTVTTVTGIDLGLPHYIRSKVDGAVLSFKSAEDIASRLRSMTLQEREDCPCVGKERADLVLAGCIILEAICQVWQVGRLCVADRGIREGVLIDLMAAADQEAEENWSHGS
ncbi:Ppx/GppA phosphatase family protein [Curvivirga aplysinae]|uniref:Ppx/GppA phosphatase family protein n=1 Tax=Curvivirga aplysinae TaxID=2529852 RepID=UPI001F3FD4E7|nr:Ppx/GppA phosphatase family protein [Curvivirga aplysinae]